MDPSEYPINSPRKELQGPRPPALKVRKDSYKIKKPPVAPQQSEPIHHHQQQPPRAPVIIYTVSPKVIHTNPNDFMNLVQRLTGSSSSSSSSTWSNNPPHDRDGHMSGGAISPAARYAAIEKAKPPPRDEMKQTIGDVGFAEGTVENMSHHQVMEKSSLFPGILSPGPSSLPPISPNLFAPPSDQNSVAFGFFQDLSPVLHGNRNFIDQNGFVMPSPSNFVSPHNIFSPSIDIFNNFNNFFDL